MHLIYRRNSSPPGLANGHGGVTDSSKRGGDDCVDTRKEKLFYLPSIDANDNSVVAEDDKEKNSYDVQDGLQAYTQAGKPEENTGISLKSDTDGSQVRFDYKYPHSYLH